jgi:hypothetical protein
MITYAVKRTKNRLPCGECRAAPPERRDAAPRAQSAEAGAFRTSPGDFIHSTPRDGPALLYLPPAPGLRPGNGTTLRSNALILRDVRADGNRESARGSASEGQKPQQIFGEVQAANPLGE